MTARPDPDRLIRAFLEEGQTELATPVYDAVRAAIEERRQRTFIGPWRLPPMRRFVPIAIAAAAVVVVLVAGLQLLAPPPSGVAGPSAGPTASPVPSSGLATDGSLGPGPHVLVGGDHPVTVQITASGWFGDAGNGFITKDDHVDAPDGAGLIAFADPGGYLVYGDGCTWKATTPTTPATTVDDVIAALGRQVGRDASTPTPIALDGHAGMAITLHTPGDPVHAPDDERFATCDDRMFGSWGTAVDPTPNRYQQDPGQIDEVWVVDVGGVVAIVDFTYYPDTPKDVIDELRAIAESSTFSR